MNPDLNRPKITIDHGEHRQQLTERQALHVVLLIGPAKADTTLAYSSALAQIASSLSAQGFGMYSCSNSRTA